MATLISYKIDFKTKNCVRDSSPFHKDKTGHSLRIIIIYAYTPNTSMQCTYMKQKPNEQTREIHIVSKKGIPPFSAWYNNQAKKKKISKNIYQNNTAKHLDLSNIYRTSYPIILQNTNSFYCIRCVHKIDIDWPIKKVTMNIKGLILRKKKIWP